MNPFIKGAYIYKNRTVIYKKGNDILVTLSV